MNDLNNYIKYLNPPKALKNQKDENSCFSHLVATITVQSSLQNKFLIRRGKKKDLGHNQLYLWGLSLTLAT